MTKKGKSQVISEYLWCRIRRRVKQLGLTNIGLAEQLGQSEANISRMMTQKVTRITYLDELRVILSLPDDDLEKRFKEHSEGLIEFLARVMATNAAHADAFLEDIGYLAGLYRRTQETHEMVVLMEAEIRSLKGKPEQLQSLTQYAKLKAIQAELEKKRRKLISILN